MTLYLTIYRETKDAPRLHFLEVCNLTLEEENMLRVLWSGIATENLMETMGAISCVL